MRSALRFLLLCALAGPVGAAAQDAVFPAAPQKAHYRHIETISGETGFQRDSNWWGRVKSLITGREQSVRLVRPQGVDLQHNVLLVADPGAGLVHRFDLDERGYSHLPHRDKLPSPVDAAAGDRDIVYVSDSHLGRVLRFDARGKRLADLDHDFQRPTGLAYDRERGRLYVVDTSLSTIEVFDENEAHVATFGGRGEGPGRFNLPTKICTDGDGHLYVNDAMNFRIQILDIDGTCIGSVGSQGDAPGYLSRPRGVAVDDDGHIYISDALQDAFQVFTQQGELLLFVGGEGDGPGRFRLPADMAMDGDVLCIADSYNGRVQLMRYLGE
jgi:sugar lactone lactonase YvrE